MSTKTSTPLPTIDELKTMPLEERTKVFLQWLEEQPRKREYYGGSLFKCAMGQFANAVGPNLVSTSSPCCIQEVFEEGIITDSLQIVMDNWCFHFLFNHTYGALHDALVPKTFIEKIKLFWSDLVSK